jgi:hypothetical protein
MTDLMALKAANERRWVQAKLLKPGTFTATAKHLVAPSSDIRLFPRNQAFRGPLSLSRMNGNRLTAT